jgi:hypothetical protein
MIPDGIELVKSMDIVRRKIYAALDTLCQKNEDIFQRKFGLQTKNWKGRCCVSQACRRSALWAI